jgi:hypothetical protein
MNWERLTLVVARRTLVEPNKSFTCFVFVVSLAGSKASIAAFNEERASSHRFRLGIVGGEGEGDKVSGAPDPSSIKSSVYFIFACLVLRCLQRR